MRRRFALTTFLNALGACVNLLISLLMIPLMLRTLGTEAYGVWVLVTTFSVASGYLSLLDFGIQSSIVKFVAEHYGRQELGAINQIFSIGIYLFGGIGLLAAVALTFFAKNLLTQIFNIPSGLVEMTRLLLYFLAVQTLVEFPALIFSALLDGLQRYDLQRLIQIGQVVLSSMMLVALLLSGYGLLSLGLTMLVMAICRLLVMVILARRLLPRLRLVLNFDAKLLHKVAAFSAQIFLIRLNAIIYNTKDKTIIGASLISTMLTGYDIAHKMRNIAMIPLSFITPQVVPITARLNAVGDQARLQELFLMGTKYQLALCLPVVVSVMVLSESFVSTWIGPDYAFTANLARLFASYILLDAVVVVGYNIIIGMDRVKPLLLIQTITTTTINLILSIILTPRLGVAGVIWGTLIGTACSVGPYLWLYFSVLDIAWARFWREVLWPAYFPAALFAGLLYGVTRFLMPNNLWTLAGLGLSGLIVYALLFSILSMNHAERKMFIKMARLRL
jgi:O-antigen/teichoic acid export membrane protein